MLSPTLRTLVSRGLEGSVTRTPVFFVVAPAIQQKIWFGQKRTLTRHASPGPDPLAVMRKESMDRNLCDDHGYRRPGVHWVFSIAVAPEGTNKPPNLRTVGLQRIAPDGIDFVMKRNTGTTKALTNGNGLPVSFLYLKGKYQVGEKAQQWRAEGHCELLDLSDILDKVPHYTISGMIATKRLEKEDENKGGGDDSVSEDRLLMARKSHFTEVTQKVRIELENGDIANEEMDESIRAFRFLPDRMECMFGGPDAILWERWEWLRSGSGSGVPEWNDPKQLLPY